MDASKAERREGYTAALYAGRPFSGDDIESYDIQLEIQYGHEVVVPDGYTREQTRDLLEGYEEGYAIDQPDYSEITSVEETDFAGYPALLFAEVHDIPGYGASGKYTVRHIAFLADRKLWVFECRHWPDLPGSDNQTGADCDTTIASVKSK